MLKEFQSRSKETIILESGFFALIIFCMLLGNSLTLIVVALNRRMRTIPNMLVTSLALTDFTLAVISAGPLGIGALVTSRWPFSDAACQYQGYIGVTLALASTQTLALMAVNRYFRIVKPAKYQRYFTKKKTTIMIIVAWLWSMCAPLPYLLSGNKMLFHPSKFFCFLNIDSGAFTVFMVSVYIGLPTCVIFYCYLRIYKTVRSHNNNFQTSGSGASTANVEEIKVARTLFVIVVFFNLCWVPVLLIDIVDTISGRWIFKRHTYVAYTFLATASSALNPIIYGLLNKSFQVEYLKMLRCFHCRSQTIVKPFFFERRAGTGS